METGLDQTCEKLGFRLVLRMKIFELFDNCADGRGENEPIKKKEWNRKITVFYVV